MKNLSFSPLYLSKLTLNGLYSLNRSVIELSKPVISQIGAIAAAGLTNLETINLKLGAALNKATKSAFTDELNVLDQERDEVFLEIKREVSVGVKSSNEAKRLAGSALQLFITPYNNAYKLAQDIETGVLSEMLSKREASPDLKAASATLNIEGLFTLLDTKNKAFDVKFIGRNTEYSERGNNATSQRQAVITASMQFFAALEQTVNLAPNDTVLALFYQLDELRKKYRLTEGGSDAKPAAAPAK